MSQLIDMMLKYPSVLPVNSEQTEFVGYLPVNGTDYKVHIKRENDKLIVDVGEQLQQFKQEISHLPHGDNIAQLLNSLKTIIASKTTPHACENLTDAYKHVLSEYVELREFYIGMYKCSILQDLSEIQISHMDGCSRIYDLTIRSDFGENEVFKVSRHSLPENNGELFQPNNSLKAVYEQFTAIVDKLQPFFNAMDSLDASCWILDPEVPSRKDCYRRVGLDSNLSLIATLDPWSNSSVPNIKFLGPEQLVENFRSKVAKNLIDWDTNSNVADEILKLLELPSFPASPASATKGEILLCDIGECCICFSLRLNDKLPEIICQNASCEQFFHKECLYQWLVSVSAKQSFNELHGQCPNCEKHISCPL